MKALLIVLGALLLIAVVLLAIISSVGPDGAALIVYNQSTEGLTNVTMESSAFRYVLPQVGPGEIAAFDGHGFGEVHAFTFSFVASGRPVTTRHETYFEGSAFYVVLIDVAPDLSVKSHVSIRTSEPNRVAP